MERELNKDKLLNENRINLLVSCVYFLKIFSTKFSYSKYFQKSDDIAFLAKALHAEQNLESLCDSPLPLEDTWLSGNVEYLLQTTSGAWKLRANSFSTFRVMNRLADTLEGKEEDFFSGVNDIFKENNDFNINEIKDTAVNFKRIKEFFMQGLEKKVSKEKDYLPSLGKG